MSWETRNGKGRYYIRAFRDGGRVVREYFGTGMYGEYWASVDADARAERAARAADVWTELEALDELDQLVATYAEAVEVIALEVLEAAGYRRHQRGEWRKTRVQA